MLSGHFFTWEESTEQDACNLSFKPNCTNVKARKVVNPHSFIPRHYEEELRGCDFPFGIAILKDQLLSIIYSPAHGGPYSNQVHPEIYWY